MTAVRIFFNSETYRMLEAKELEVYLMSPLIVFDMYGIYHVERLENAYEDIDALVAERA